MTRHHGVPRERGHFNEKSEEACPKQEEQQEMNTRATRTTNFGFSVWLDGSATKGLHFFEPQYLHGGDGIMH